MLSLLRLERKQTNSSKPFRIRIFLFLSYSFGIETINIFLHSRSSRSYHSRFQTKISKVYTRFQTKMAQKPYPMPGAAHIYIAYIREYPRPPGGGSSRLYKFCPNLCLRMKVYGNDFKAKENTIYAPIHPINS